MAAFPLRHLRGCGKMCTFAKHNPNLTNNQARTMKYYEIGKTGMKVSALSFGASSLGGVFHEINENRALDAVYTAVDNGMNFIDVSPYYGHYKAETVLGKALPNIERGKYYLSTKVGRYGKDGVNTWDYSARRAKESVYESLERLHIDYIDLINVHDVEFSDLSGERALLLPLLPERRHAHRLFRLLREQGHRHHQRLSLRHGTALQTRSARLASRSQGTGGGMPKGYGTLRGQGISHRETGHPIRHQQSAHSDYPFQFGQPRQREEEHPIRGGAH